MILAGSARPGACCAWRYWCDWRPAPRGGVIVMGGAPTTFICHGCATHHKRSGAVARPGESRAVHSMTEAASLAGGAGGFGFVSPRPSGHVAIIINVGVRM